MGTPAPTEPHVQLSKAVGDSGFIELAGLLLTKDFAKIILDERDVKEREERVHELEQARFCDEAVLVLRGVLVIF